MRKRNWEICERKGRKMKYKEKNECQKGKMYAKGRKMNAKELKIYAKGRK
jgi:hypothetical protein